MTQSSSNNIETSALILKDTENQSAELTKIKTRVAAAMFALIMQANPVFSGEKITVANNANTLPSASVPAAEKGGGQVMETQYGPLSFAEINKHTDKKNILNGMTDKQFNAYELWKEGTIEAANQEEKKIDTNIQAGNQRVEIKKGVEQSINQEEKKIDTNIQAAINKIILQIPQVVPRYEADIAQGKKIPFADKKALEFAIKAGEPKEWIKRIEKLLSNPQNFA